MASSMESPHRAVYVHDLDVSKDEAITRPADATLELQTQYWADLIRSSLASAHGRRTNDDKGQSDTIDDAIMEAPRRGSARGDLAKSIAAELYPDLHGPLAAVIQYEKDVVLLRSLVVEQRRRAIAEATKRNEGLNWIKRISEQGPWDESDDPLSLDGASSLPMPVEQSDRESLAPFFAHLRNGGTYRPDPASPEGIAGVEEYNDVDFVEFEKGVLYSDGRVDLCKMVTGPRNISDLMESLKPNTFSKHFLLGNNIIGPTGAKAIAAFIEEHPERFETWYLAGNCIDRDSFSLLVDSMVKSSCITNVWLKRNPLGPQAAHDAFRLITESKSLRTLDLDQTQLGDEGIAELFRLLSQHSATEPLALRHVYLNACGVGEKACMAIGRYLRSSNCTIESLYLSLNPIGDAIVHIAEGLKQNATVQRLVMQSCGLKDPGVIAIAKALNGNTAITALDLGQGYATADLGMRFNWITDGSRSAIVNLLHSTQLQYFNISYTPMSQKVFNLIPATIAESKCMQWYFAKSLTTGGRDVASVKAGQEAARLNKLVRAQLHENVLREHGVAYSEFEYGERRFLINPRDVRLIDSIYRNRDTDVAKRGLKKLKKWWDDGDDTLARVYDCTL